MGMNENKRKAMMESVYVWHEPLGSNSRLYHIDFLKNVSVKNKFWFCDSCSKAKHIILPFHVSSIKTHDCFDLIHCDI